jgi:hypothetical protein
MATMTMSQVPSQLNSEAAAALRASMRGQIILPGDETFDEARKLYNGMIDKHPRVIAQCADTADVQSAVNFARENHLEVAIRGGGHNGPGFGSVDNGLVIDLSPMRSVRVDATDSSVRVDGGCIWGDVDHATHTYGLAVPRGLVSTTGVGGFTLGGGISNLSRKYGLAIDSLLEVDMVLADGSIVTASASDHPDLFWAVRGGGGNFGVVTSFLFQGHPVHTVYGGPMMWTMEQGTDILRYWQQLMLSAPDDLYGWFGWATIPPVDTFPVEHHMKKMAIVMWTYTGPMETSEETFGAIRKDMPPAIDFCGPIPFPAINNMFDALFPPGLQWYWRADFFKHYDNKAIALHQKYGEMLPTPLSGMHIYPINGAAGRVGKTDTAWAYRDANFAQVIVGIDPDPANNERMIVWAKDYWTALHPYSAGGAYVNMMMDEGGERVEAAYSDNYTRLTQVKAKYDPANFFHVNQNIKPAG